MNQHSPIGDSAAYRDSTAYDVLADWLESIEPKTKFTAGERLAVARLVREPAFAHLVGSLMAERQGILLQLVNVPLGTPENAAHASVLQGYAKGVAALMPHLLDICLPQDDQDKE